MDNIELVNKYFEGKYRCSQAVFAIFAIQYGLTVGQALKISGCFKGYMQR